MKASLLLVEDDEDLALGLRFNLEQEGYGVDRAATLTKARELLEKKTPDLVLLDLALPDGSGLDLLREVRAKGSPVAIIALTARGTEADIVMGLKLGADDYLPKPFGLAQLMARIEAVLRRSRGSEPAPPPVSNSDATARGWQLGPVLVDPVARLAILGQERRELTPIEIEILRYLAARPGQAVERRDLLRDLWGLDRYVTTRTLDNHIARLRKKIEVDPELPRYLVTVHGIGYRLDL